MTTDRVPPVTVDVVVVGAGINGLAASRELARQGFTVALLERGDIGGETTAISTRLIHGGFKYLERGEISLVWECARERNILFRTAPHLIRHYPMLIPFSVENKRPWWMILAGLALQDLLAPIKPLPLSQIVGPGKMKARWPGLFASGITRGAIFQDSQVPLTERLCLELALDASAHGAHVMTYSEVTGFVTEESRITGVKFTSVRTGEEHTIQAQFVINATGPFVDSLLEPLNLPEPFMGPTRGSHIMVGDFPGSPSTCVFFESADDHRPMFILPWEGLFMLGTTDVPDGHIDGPIVTQVEEVDYLLDSVNHLIPLAALRRDHVLWTYSGLRPLPYVGNVDDPSKITREYRLEKHAGQVDGLYSVIGGKLTTHRALGEDVARQVCRALGKKWKGSSTKRARLPGAPIPASLVAPVPSWLEPHSRQRLRSVYGAFALKIWQLADERPELRAVVDPQTGAIAAEVLWAVDEEGARTLSDIVLRRMVLFINTNAGIDAAERVAATMVTLGKWTEDRAGTELADYREWLLRYTPTALGWTW